MNKKSFIQSSKRTRRVTGTVLVSMLLTAPAQAFVNSGLFLSLESEPDIFSDGIQVDYDANTQQFTASGFAEDILTGGAFSDIDDGNFFLEATIDNSGEWFGGSLSIEGTVPDLGFNSPPTPNVLLTGDLAKFGSVDDASQPDNDELNFVFDNIGGDAASLFNGTAGVILTNTGALGGLASAVFSQSFSNNGQGFSNTGAPERVPEPSSLGLMLAGSLLLIYKSRRRKTTTTV